LDTLKPNSVESSIEQLKASIKEQALKEKIIIGSVRYLDFENDPIDEGHENYGLFMKRKAFEHEKELRAIIPLSEGKEGKGILVKCDLDTLITSIHISPLSPLFIKKDVESLLQKLNINKTVIRSNLLEQPSY
jgi:predicted ATPase